ncbi:hypothetical protein EVAR_89909_1 [Eumeta japonica]|uniref:Uncharacterized protein n=1 Tax=Eumeta variegata TaxID=151549 RepID=A0A4C2ACN8_EUMVA|nr:hypothetical protein EVAR_89909_1 [Eumeta japonica]
MSPTRNQKTSFFYSISKDRTSHATTSEQWVVTSVIGTHKSRVKIREHTRGLPNLADFHYHWLGFAIYILTLNSRRLTEVDAISAKAPLPYAAIIKDRRAQVKCLGHRPVEMKTHELAYCVVAPHKR